METSKYLNLETNQGFPTEAGILFSLRAVLRDVSLVARLARLFREPTADDGVRAPADASTDPSTVYRGDGGDRAESDGDEAASEPSTEGAVSGLAVVVQEPPAGVRRYELTVRAGTAISTVDPGLLTRHFERFDDATGVVRARAVDVDGKGRTIETATPLFTVRFDEPVDPDTVSVDGTLTGHDEEPVPWSRVRLTPVD